MGSSCDLASMRSSQDGQLMRSDGELGQMVIATPILPKVRRRSIGEAVQIGRRGANAWKATRISLREEGGRQEGDKPAYRGKGGEQHREAEK